MSGVYDTWDFEIWQNCQTQALERIFPEKHTVYQCLGKSTLCLPTVSGTLWVFRLLVVFSQLYKPSSICITGYVDRGSQLHATLSDPPEPNEQL